jgi:hypothetical protein
MFANELTLGSFFQRLSFTTDGAFLVVPAALWHGIKSTIEEKNRGAGEGVGHSRSPTSVSEISIKIRPPSNWPIFISNNGFPPKVSYVLRT